MYDFIFIYYFRLLSLTKNKHADPQFGAIGILAICGMFHGFLFHDIITYFLDVNLLRYFFKGEHHKYFWMPFLIVYMNIIYKVYQKRVERVIQKYQSNVHILSWKNTFLVVIGLTLAPLLVGIYLVNHAEVMK